MLEIQREKAQLDRDGEPPSIYSHMTDQGKYLKKNYEPQMPGLCGPAFVRVILKSALQYQLQNGIISPEQADKIKIPDQRKIATTIMSGPLEEDYWQVVEPFVLPKDVEFYKNIGLRMYCLPEDIAKYLGSGVSFKENQTIDDLKKFIVVDKKPVAVLWNEVIPDRHGTREGGHWSLAIDYNASKDTFNMIDTSLAERSYDPRGHVVSDVFDRKQTYWTIKSTYHIPAQYLGENLYDKAVIDGETREYKGAMLVIDLAKVELPKLTETLVA
jgi:hypothetical protein